MLRALRGVERIRTAVDGVADHCLATRPRHPLVPAKAKIHEFNSKIETHE